MLREHFYFFKIINGDTIYECKVGVVKGAEIRTGRKRVRNVKRDGNHNNCYKKEGKKKEEVMLHRVSLYAGEGALGGVPAGDGSLSFALPGDLMN